MSKDLEPHFDDVQTHYDLSDDFFGLFQDNSRKYSCAYFTGPTVTMEQAQLANVDQHLEQLDLKPGMTLLHVLAMTRALGALQSPKDEDPEIFRWTDGTDSHVTAEFRQGRLVQWALHRPAPEPADAPPEAAPPTVQGLPPSP